MNLRTDIITELTARNKGNIKGIESNNKKLGNTDICTVRITSDDAAQIIGKPVGNYCTVSFARLDTLADCEEIIKSLSVAFDSLIPKKADSTLIVGLGNTDITPDALGPFVADKILATRHISNTLKKTLGLEKLRSVACLIPGVLGKTGIEALDLIKAAVNKTQPQLIIAVDALACGSSERLCRTIQLSDSGISPGSGVNNRRKELSQKTLGIPVISIGMPTVIDGNSLLPRGDNDSDMMVTPKEIDIIVNKASDIISTALNIYLQPDLERSLLDSLT